VALMTIRTWLARKLAPQMAGDADALKALLVEIESDRQWLYEFGPIRLELERLRAFVAWRRGETAVVGKLRDVDKFRTVLRLSDADKSTIAASANLANISAHRTVELERQNSDLQASNNRLLDRARKAEAANQSSTVAALFFAARKIQHNTHHCHWLNAVGYRSNPLDQTLVNHVLAGAAESIRWLANNPDKLAALMQCASEIDARKASSASEPR
jgi:hypothetical protein